LTTKKITITIWQVVLIGWELPHGSPNWATHSPKVGVMGVKLKESTHGVDNLYKYLINKEKL
jgi:hypothetical protein